MFRNLIVSFIIIYNLACYSVFSQVVINEVNVNPAGGTSSAIQSLKVCSSSSSGEEYFELYNTNDCPADISCFIIGFNQGSNALNGTFRFPIGTSIPGKGFLSIGGPNSGANINIYSFCTGTNSAHLSTGNDRWYINNGDGYVCLYNASGAPIDLVYWTFSSGESSKYGTDSEISSGPTFIANPGSCSTISSLSGPSSISSGSGFVFYAGNYPSAGTVIERTTDGGLIWATSQPGTINACNGTCNTLGTCVLPIELVSFYANCNNPKKEFIWQTNSELNNKTFILEHSIDGVNFTGIYSLNGAGNSNTTRTYSTSITEENSLYNYYRLKQLTFSNEESYSNIIFANCPLQNEINTSVYPNPTENIIHVKTNLFLNQEITIYITDVLNRVIISKKLITNTSDIEFDVFNFSDGVYFLNIYNQSNLKISTNKFIKTH